MFWYLFHTLSLQNMKANSFERANCALIQKRFNDFNSNEFEWVHSTTSVCMNICMCSCLCACVCKSICTSASCARAAQHLRSGKSNNGSQLMHGKTAAAWNEGARVFLTVHREVKEREWCGNEMNWSGRGEGGRREGGEIKKKWKHTGSILLCSLLEWESTPCQLAMKFQGCHLAPRYA